MFCFYFSVQLVVLANGSLSSVHPNPTQLLPVLNVAKVSWQFLLNICIYTYHGVDWENPKFPERVPPGSLLQNIAKNFRLIRLPVLIKIKVSEDK